MSDEIANPPGVPLLAKLKFGTVGVLVGLLLGGLGAGKVWWDMSGAVSAAEQAAETASSTAEAAGQKQSAQLAHLEGRERVLQARVAASDALVDLMRQNFGLAGSNLKLARKHLDAVSAEHGLDGAKVDAAKKASTAASVDAAGDLSAQAEMIGQLIERLDAVAE